MSKETLIISLGGSVFVQDSIKADFITDFISLVKRHLDTYHFIIVVGGGKFCRVYQDAARAMGVTDADELDRIGIRVTQVNAELFRALLGSEAHAEIQNNPTKKITTEKIIVASGWKPGCSTDHDTVLLAQTYGAKKIINITNTDYLYDRDPRQHKDAKPIKQTTWAALQSIVGTEWKPGLNTPFDPVATKVGAQSKLKLIIVGPNIKNLDNLLRNKPFSGTIIS